MNTAMQLLAHTRRQLGGWSWFKKSLLVFAMLIFGTSSFLYLSPPGLAIREFLAQTVISTQHRDWAWIFVGAEKRDYMVKMSHQFTETSALEKQNLGLIKHGNRRSRSVEELISDVKDISGQFWKGKMIYVYDPTSIRVVVPNKQGEGERVSSMVQRTGAVAGINGGGFIDPDGLGNGFAPIGLIMSGFESIYSDVDANTAQHIIGFTKEGTLLVGKYSLHELQELGVRDAVSFLAPRLIANGNPQITSGDGGWGRAPRTAIGQKEDGTLIFVVIDGRQTHSVGATLKEVQDLLMKEGAVNAGLLDGGASSELVIGGEVVTKPSSRYGERRLPSGFVVLDDPGSYKADRIWDGLNKIDPGGAYDHPDFLKEQEQLKKQQSSQPKKTEPVKPEEPAKTGTSAGTGSDPGKTTTTKPSTGTGTTGGTKTGTSGTGTTTKPTQPSGGTTSGGTSGTGGTGSTGGTPPPAGTGTTAPPSGGATSGQTTTTPPSGGTSSGGTSGSGATTGGTGTTSPGTGSSSGSTSGTGAGTGGTSSGSTTSGTSGGTTSGTGTKAPTTSGTGTGTTTPPK